MLTICTASIRLTGRQHFVPMSADPEQLFGQSGMPRRTSSLLLEKAKARCDSLLAGFRLVTRGPAPDVADGALSWAVLKRRSIFGSMRSSVSHEHASTFVIGKPSPRALTMQGWRRIRYRAESAVAKQHPWRSPDVAGQRSGAAARMGLPRSACTGLSMYAVISKASLPIYAIISNGTSVVIRRYPLALGG